MQQLTHSVFSHGVTCAVQWWPAWQRKSGINNSTTDCSSLLTVCSVTVLHVQYNDDLHDREIRYMVIIIASQIAAAYPQRVQSRCYMCNTMMTCMTEKSGINNSTTDCSSLLTVCSVTVLHVQYNDDLHDREIRYMVIIIASQIAAAYPQRVQSWCYVTCTIQWWPTWQGNQVIIIASQTAAAYSQRVQPWCYVTCAIQWWPAWQRNQVNVIIAPQIAAAYPWHVQLWCYITLAMSKGCIKDAKSRVAKTLWMNMEHSWLISIKKKKK